MRRLFSLLGNLLSLLIGRLSWRAPAEASDEQGEQVAEQGEESSHYSCVLCFEVGIPIVAVCAGDLCQASS